MSTPILHHYPPSLFSEKIRTLFGYLGMEWQSVIIPPIMPRPHLMPLSGGYRKTPIMQIGANVYCDTEIICHKLAALAGNTSLYAPGFNAERVARWADTELFRTTVTLNFRPQALAAQMSRMSEDEMAAFQKDRAELSGGAPIVAGDPAAAEADFQALMEHLEASLENDFLFGAEPCIADFSVYHCLWFVAGNAANKPLFEPWPGVRRYLERMERFGHATFTEIAAEEALDIGTATKPETPADAAVEARLAGGIKAGDAVTVQPNDYGRIPVAGSLVSWNSNEIVIARQDDQAGDVMVHFPNIGFEVTAA